MLLTVGSLSNVSKSWDAPISEPPINTSSKAQAGGDGFRWGCQNLKRVANIASKKLHYCVKN